MKYDSHTPMREFQRTLRLPIKCLLCIGYLLGLMARGYGKQATPPQSDTSYIDGHGTAHITRVVPVPQTISPEAQKTLSRVVPDANVPQTLEQRRAGTDKWQIGAGEKSRAVYPVKIESQTIAGVPVRIVDPITGTQGD